MIKKNRGDVFLNSLADNSGDLGDDEIVAVAVVLMMKMTMMTLRRRRRKSNH